MNTLLKKIICASMLFISLVSHAADTPSFYANLPPSLTVYEGQDAVMVVTATDTYPGASFTYQWYRVNDLTIVSTNPNTLTISGVTISQCGQTYGVVVTDDRGNLIVSNILALTVLRDPAKQLDTLIFVNTAAAVAGCFIFGIATWMIVVIAMKETDF